MYKLSAWNGNKSGFHTYGEVTEEGGVRAVKKKIHN